MQFPPSFPLDENCFLPLLLASTKVPVSGARHQVSLGLARLSSDPCSVELHDHPLNGSLPISHPRERCLHIFSFPFGKALKGLHLKPNLKGLKFIYLSSQISNIIQEHLTAIYEMESDFLASFSLFSKSVFFSLVFLPMLLKWLVGKFQQVRMWETGTAMCAPFLLQAAPEVCVDHLSAILISNST